MQRTQGRPKESDSFKVAPEFLEKPDIEMLARALLSIAKQITEKKRQEETNSSK